MEEYFDFFNLFMRHTERERQRHRQKEKQSPRRELDAGLNPGTPGSCPEPKADAQPLSHPGCPKALVFFFFLFKASVLKTIDAAHLLLG